MKKIKTIDGNEACSRTAYIFTELSSIYPITPSSPMAEHIDEWSHQNKKNIFDDTVKVVEMQSEAGAAGMMHGALQSGILATTFTASQGLLLMIPNMYKIAGEMLPGVIHVAARSLATHALSILGDHQDIYATRMTGFAMLASSSVQDATYMSGIAHLSAIKSSIPFLHFFDGFRTSHEIKKISVLDDSDYKKLVDYESLENFRKRALNPRNPKTKGTALGDDIYFQIAESRNKNYENLPDIVNDYMNEINKMAGTDYKPFNYYGSKNAKKVIVAMGSVCETIKETIDELGGEIGLIEVHLYRPFSTKYLLNVLPKSVTKIAVLDRTKEPGSTGEPLYNDLISALGGKMQIVGGRYGLSSKNTTPAQIKAVFDMLDNPRHNFTIGILDDVTNLSLKVDENFKPSKCQEFLIYGYGSDGMVSAAKSLIKMIGDETKSYVQGYFEYDSKKSGGVTISHLRFSENIIRSSYYVDNPLFIAITKDSYLSQINTLKNIKENGICLINTTKTEEELSAIMNQETLDIIKMRKIRLYTINALEIANKYNLYGKISMIMEMAIISLTNIIDVNVAKNYLTTFIQKKFFKKGSDIVNANIKALDEASRYIKQITINYIEKMEKDKNDLYHVMEKREGNSLPVSAFLKYQDGAFTGGSSKLDKRKISEQIPHWISENCINCNMCSFVCPHGVIRPYLISEEEYLKLPSYIQNRCLKQKDGYYYVIAISAKDCSGCGVCINTCPSKNKALIIDEYNEIEQDIFDYLDKNIKTKEIFNKETIKGSQFIKPKFAFSGACAGCGEVAYIKILTQLFSDELVIANATGCSSIYGASMPSLPYEVPWANSLFEDNAEFGYGILMGNNVIKNRIKNIMENNIESKNKELFTKWLQNSDDYKITKEVYDNIDYENAPVELKNLKEYIPSKTIWAIGGDGWAYDIGFSGIDHVLASNDNINILVLDSQVYSNTGGQSSKASPKGIVAPFASSGKKNAKKDLARIALSYPNAYVAQVSLGANMMQLIKAFTEAKKHNGPSIIIAYTPCISHGIDGGLKNSIEFEKLATNCGYHPIFRYVPSEKKFYLDSKNVNFDAYDEFLEKQGRYKLLKSINPSEADRLLKENKEEAMRRFQFYQNLAKEKEL